MAITNPNSKAGGTGSGAGSQDAGQTSRSTGQFLREVITELKKTTWPTRQEATRLTTLVIAVIVVLGIYMGLLDAILSFLVSKFSLIK